MINIAVDGKLAGLFAIVDERLAGLDVRLVEAADAVHAVRHDHAVPMHRGVFRQLVGDEDPDLVAFDRFDGQ